MSIQLADQSVNGIKMRVSVSGSGPPLLLVHGFPLSHQMWKAQIDWFQNHFTVIAPDLRGFGASEITRGTIRMEQHADDLNALLDTLKIEEPVNFCGLSMGGYIAWEFWDHFPQRLHTLILCDTRSGSDSEEGINTRMKMVDLVLKHGPKSISSSMIPNLLSEASQRDDPNLTKNLMDMIESTDREGIAASQCGMAHRKDFTARLVEIRVPTLLIVGSEDRLTPPDVMKPMTSQLENAEYCEVPGAGHMSPMEAPTFVNEAMEAFLASC
ncbi:MAG: alpha/beta fold hydrolase [Gimesia sp.]